MDESGRARARFVIENNGNGGETLRIIPRSLLPGSVVSLPPPVSVPVGQILEIETDLALPLHAPPRTTALAYRLVADDASAWELEWNLTVPERQVVTLDPVEPAVSLVGRTRPTKLAVINDGNVPLPLPPRLLGPEGWRFDFASPKPTLEPGERAILSAEVTLAPDVKPGRALIAPDPAWARGAAVPWEARSVVLSATPAPSEPGTTAVKIRNAGTGDAYDVVVELEQDGRVRDHLTLRRVPAGEEVYAVLAGQGGAARVVVDRPLAYGATPTLVDAEISGRANVPFAPVIFIIAAVAWAAVTFRSRRSQEPPR